MKTKKINELFVVTKGNELNMSKMTPLPRAKGGVNFIGRSDRNHSISGTVAVLPDVEPYPSGLITVALGGTPLKSIVQGSPFYTSKNVAVLLPIEKMTFAENVYVCLCIWHNRFRYSAFGREANRTLGDLLIPSKDEFPAWVNDPSTKAGVQAAIESDIRSLFFAVD